MWEIYGFKWENWMLKVQSCCHNNRKKWMTILHYVFSRSYDLERRLCSQVCKTNPMLWRKGLKNVLNFLLCIPEGLEVQSQSLVVGCAPLSLHVPFFYKKILFVMIYLSNPYVLSIELLAGYKRNWIFSIKLYLMGRCFLNFLPNTLLVVFNVISLYMHAFDI